MQRHPPPRPGRRLGRTGPGLRLGTRWHRAIAGETVRCLPLTRGAPSAKEKNSVATTSNESFGACTKTFTDPRLCAAIVDRLAFNGTIIETGTDSHRLVSTRARAEEPAKAGSAHGDQTYGVVVVTAWRPSRVRIGALSAEASTYT